MFLLGHRGARAYAPENSIEAFALAIEHGCHGFELDVRLDGERVAVCCHDAYWKEVEVSASSAAALDLATLERVLEEHPTAFLDIEMKVTGVTPLFTPLLNARDPERTVISSFLPAAVREAQRYCSGIAAGLICDSDEQMTVFPELDCEVLIPHYTLVTTELVDDLHARGKRVLTWTVNAPEQILRVARAGVDGIISDDTQLLVRLVRDMIAPVLVAD